MKRRKIILAAGGVLLVTGGWYAFRPELLFIDAVAHEAPLVGDGAARTIARGRFHGVAHEGEGLATVYELPDGSRALRLTEFRTSNGPDVHVYAVAAADATDAQTVTRAGFIPLGALKGNVGDQNYALPAVFDPAKHRAVTIWCKRFGVNFATAPLAPASGEIDGDPHGAGR